MSLQSKLKKGKKLISLYAEATFDSKLYPRPAVFLSHQYNYSNYSNLKSAPFEINIKLRLFLNAFFDFYVSHGTRLIPVQQVLSRCSIQDIKN